MFLTLYNATVTHTISLNRRPSLIRFSYLVTLVTVLTISIGEASRAEPLKEFIKACTYGVLAGTLVGTASLAFTSKPGDNLGNIARGASLGLYAGMALGAYVIYFVPAQGEKRPEELNLDELPESESPSEDDSAHILSDPVEVARNHNILSFGPTLNGLGKIDGVTASWNFSF